MLWRVPSTLRQDRQDPTPLRQTGKIYPFFYYYLLCRSLAYEKRLSCHPLQPWSPAPSIAIDYAPAGLLIQQSFWPCGFLHRGFDHSMHRAVQISWQQPWTEPAFHSPHLALKLHFPPIPCHKSVSPPFSHLPSHTHPPYLLIQVAMKKRWLLQPFISAILSKTTGRLLTAFTCQHRHIGQPWQPHAVW